jgi:hypothetical protein
MQSQQKLHSSTIYFYVAVTVMDPSELVLNLCTPAVFHLHGEEPTYIHHTIHTNLLRPTASVWDPLSNSCPTLLMKAQGDLKAHISYIKISTLAIKQVKSSGKLMSAHTVSQRGKKPMTEGRPARNMQESASATLCFTCASSQSHCERSIGGTYHVPGGK